MPFKQSKNYRFIFQKDKKYMHKRLETKKIKKT